MRYLLDTNILVYITCDYSSLDSHVRDIYEDYSSILYTSSESIKEMVLIYRKLKKKPIFWKNEKAMIESLEKDFGIHILPVKKEHLLTYAALTTPEDHNDPSDHVIISQAITEKIPLISSDLKFPFYKKQKLDFIYNKK